MSSSNGSDFLVGSRVPMSNEEDTDLRTQYQAILKNAMNISSSDQNRVERLLLKLRELILTRGLPSETAQERNALISPNMSYCTLRGKIWKALLRVPEISAQHYIDTLRNGPTPQYNTIYKDVERTFTTNKEFRTRAPEPAQRRVMNSFVLMNGGIDIRESSSTSTKQTYFTYVQGMNTLCAPLLFVMPELDAFATFTRILTLICPTYVRHDLVGAKAGAKLVGHIIRSKDVEYADYLSKEISGGPTIYAFESIVAFMMNTKNFFENIKLWDFYVAFGFHMNVLVVASQILLLKQQVYDAKAKQISITTLFRPLPDYNVKSAIAIALQLMKDLPQQLYTTLVYHLLDDRICQRILDSSSANTSSGRPGTPSGDKLLDIDSIVDFDEQENWRWEQQQQTTNRLSKVSPTGSVSSSSSAFSNGRISN